MPESSLLPLWDPEACVPREEVLTGTLTDADLALRLGLVVSGHARKIYTIHGHSSVYAHDTQYA